MPAHGIHYNLNIKGISLGYVIYPLAVSVVIELIIHFSISIQRRDCGFLS